MAEKLSRRDALRGAGVVAGLGGVAGIGVLATEPAKAKASVEMPADGIQLRGDSVTLENGERVSDVTLQGEATVMYESPDVPVEMGVVHGQASDNEGGPHGEHHFETKHADLAAHSGEFTSPLSFSLTNDMEFSVDELNPEPGNTVKYGLQLVVVAEIHGGGKKLASYNHDDHATVTISRPESGEPASIEFSGEYALSIQTSDG